MNWNWQWTGYGFSIGAAYGLLAHFLHLPSAFDIAVLLGQSIYGTSQLVFAIKEIVYTGILGGLIGGVASVFLGEEE